MKLAMGEEIVLHWSWVEKQQQNNIIFVEHHQEEHTESWQKINTKY